MDTLRALSLFLCDWYECDEAALSGLKEHTQHICNPVLREFYERFGALAEKTNAFRHPKSDSGPLSAQDSFSAAKKIRAEKGKEVFLVENQGNFVIAASDDDFAHVKGDLGEERFVDFTATSIPLTESLIANALQETVLSVSDRCSSRTAVEEARLSHQLNAATKLYLRTVHDNDPYCFFITPDLIGMGFGAEPDFFASRGQWRKQPTG